MDLKNKQSDDVLYCSAIIDAVVYLSGMVKTGLCRILPPIAGQTETLHFVISKNGTNLLVNLTFDSDKKPIIATNNNISLRWFSVVKWGCLILDHNKITLCGEDIDAGDNLSIPGIIIEIPVCEKVSQIIGKHVKVGIGFSDGNGNTVYVTKECDVAKKC